MSWLFLFLAGLFEVAWAVGLKMVDGFNRPVILLLTIVCLALSVSLLGCSMKVIPLGTAYAIWTGIGMVGAFAIGVAFFGESLTAIKLVSALFIIAGLIGLKLSTNS